MLCRFHFPNKNGYLLFNVRDPIKFIAQNLHIKVKDILSKNFLSNIKMEKKSLKFLENIPIISDLDLYLLQVRREKKLCQIRIRRKNQSLIKKKKNQMVKICCVKT